MGDQQVITWISRYIQSSAEDDLFVDEAYAVYSKSTEEPVSKIRFTKTVHGLYDVKTITKRWPGNYNRKMRAYRGVKLSTDDTCERLVTSSVIRDSLQASFGQITVKDESLFLILPSEDTRNGSRAIREITIQKLNDRAHFDCLVWGKNVNLKALNVDIDTGYSPESISATLRIIQNLQFCHGAYDKSANTIWSTLANKSEIHTSRHSRNCLCLVPLTSIKKICTPCLKSAVYKKRLHNKEKENEPDQTRDEETIKELQLNNLNVIIRDLGLPEDCSVLLMEQGKNITVTDVRQRRWHPRMIRVCLSWWASSPETYNMWRTNGTLILPHPNTLKTMKNRLQQKPGVNDDNMTWMLLEADVQGLTAEQRCGGIVFDEMSIQEDLHVVHKGCDTYTGLVEMTPEVDAMSQIGKGRRVNDPTHVDYVPSLLLHQGPEVERLSRYSGKDEVKVCPGSDQSEKHEPAPDAEVLKQEKNTLPRGHQGKRSSKRKPKVQIQREPDIQAESMEKAPQITTDTVPATESMDEYIGHLKALQTLCRICGEVVMSNKMKSLKNDHVRYLQISKELFATELLDLYDIDINQDIPSIHPELVCASHKSILCNYRKCLRNGKPFYTETDVCDFKPHCDDCKVCSSHPDIIRRVAAESAIVTNGCNVSTHNRGVERTSSTANSHEESLARSMIDLDQQRRLTCFVRVFESITPQERSLLSSVLDFVSKRHNTLCAPAPLNVQFSNPPISETGSLHKGTKRQKVDVTEDKRLNNTLASATQFQGCMSEPTAEFQTVTGCQKPQTCSPEFINISPLNSSITEGHLGGTRANFDQNVTPCSLFINHSMITAPPAVIHIKPEPDDSVPTIQPFPFTSDIKIEEPVLNSGIEYQ